MIDITDRKLSKQQNKIQRSNKLIYTIAYIRLQCNGIIRKSIPFLIYPYVHTLCEKARGTFLTLPAPLFVPNLSH